MVNLTYGYLEEGGINPLGPDLIATIDGESTAYGSGDIAWVLTCGALIVLMVSSSERNSLPLHGTRLTVTVARSGLPLLRSHAP